MRVSGPPGQCSLYETNLESKFLGPVSKHKAIGNVDWVWVVGFTAMTGCY